MSGRSSKQPRPHASAARTSCPRSTFITTFSQHAATMHRECFSRKNSRCTCVQAPAALPGKAGCPAGLQRALARDMVRAAVRDRATRGEMQPIRFSSWNQGARRYPPLRTTQGCLIAPFGTSPASASCLHMFQVAKRRGITAPSHANSGNFSNTRADSSSN